MELSNQEKQRRLQKIKELEKESKLLIKHKYFDAEEDNPKTLVSIEMNDSRCRESLGIVLYDLKVDNLHYDGNYYTIGYNIIEEIKQFISNNNMLKLKLSDKSYFKIIKESGFSILDGYKTRVFVQNDKKKNILSIDNLDKSKKYLYVDLDYENLLKLIRMILRPAKELRIDLDKLKKYL